MARVKANQKCFIENTIRNEGDEFDYDGPDNGCVDPVKKSRARASATPDPSADPAPVATDPAPVATDPATDQAQG